MKVVERSFSDLLRRPKEVTRVLDNADVLLRRRDEPDLRLSRADRESERAAAFASLGRTVRSLAVHQPIALDGALTEAFPWLEFLPPEERDLFLEEFSRTVLAAGELESYSGLAQLVREWHATALIHADPQLARELVQPLPGSGPLIEPPPA